MRREFIRTEMLLGVTGMQRLEDARVAVFGLGGVGGHAAEALARSGVGRIDLIDHDIVTVTNINRQLAALQDTIGRDKTGVIKERIQNINPDCDVRAYECFYLPETAKQFHLEEYDYILDAVDTVTAKLELAVRAAACHTPLISCMGAGNKLDPTRFEIADIYKTSVCPLAKVMRKELAARGIKALKVVYSREPSIKPFDFMDTFEDCQRESGRPVPGSTAFVPAVAGLIMAGEVIKDIADGKGRDRSTKKGIGPYDI